MLCIRRRHKETGRSPIYCTTVVLASNEEAIQTCHDVSRVATQKNGTQTPSTSRLLRKWSSLQDFFKLRHLALPGYSGLGLVCKNFELRHLALPGYSGLGLVCKIFLTQTPSTSRLLRTWSSLQDFWTANRLPAVKLPVVWWSEVSWFF